MSLRAGALTGLMNQSTAQVIDGSLKFDSSKSQYLTKTPSSNGNRKTWTYSAWIKRNKLTDTQGFFESYRSSSPGSFFIGTRTSSDDFAFAHTAGYTSSWATPNKIRDIGWYHFMVVSDTTSATSTISNGSTDRYRVYINGEQVSISGGTVPSQNFDTQVNDSSYPHYIGRFQAGGFYCNSQMSQVYLIDGQALGPEYFGFTDPLTNTWRPKKFSGNFTVNDGYSKVWSSEISGTQFNSSNPKEHAFDGNLNTWTTATNGNSLTWTPSGGLAVSSSLRIYAAREGSNDNITVTFTDTTTFNSFTADNTFKWYTITGAGGKTIDNIVWTHNNTFSRIAAIEVDGTILTDFQGTNSFYLPMDGNSPIGQDKSGNGNDWTPVNFGGSNTIEKATGALPILNTDGGGKVARVGVRTDSNSSSLVLALPLVGSANDVSNQINSGSTTKVITANGNASASTTQSNFYGGSFYFDGTGDYLSVAENSDFQFASSAVDFTIEAYVYGSAFSGTYTSIVSVWGTTAGTDQWLLSVNTSGVLAFAWSPYSNGSNFLSGGTLSTNKWHHVAVTRSGNTFRLFLNGIVVASGTNSATSTDNTQLEIGRYGAGGTPSSEWQGYIQEVRIYKGVAKYTENFIPASTNPDILPDTPSGVSGGSKLTKITDGAVSFDGNGDYLNVPATDEFTFGTGDFTIETFVYHNTLGGSGNVIIDFRDAPDNADAGALWKTSGGEFGWYVNGSNRVTGATVAANKWYHVALVRNSGTTSLYVDGISVGSFSDSFNYATKSGRAHIGFLSDGTGTLYLDGFISNFRINKGTALYTANFTPPSAPLTNVTNTKLLCCQSTTPFITGGQPVLNTNNTGITTTSGTRVDTFASNLVLALPLNGSNGGTTFTDYHHTIKGSGSAKIVSKTGNAQTSTTQSKFYGSSLYLDGSDDELLSIPNTTDFDLSGDFTVEFWFYLNSISGSGNSFVGKWDNGAYAWIIQLMSASSFRFYSGNSGSLGSAHSFTGGTVSAQTWHHVATTRSGSTLTMYLDGQSIGTATNSNNLTATEQLTIGTNFESRDQTINGYINDLRIYKGAVKYTSNFNPTAPLVQPEASVSPSSILGVDDAAATTFNPFNTDINTVRGQETGYATLNPLAKGTAHSLSNGNLDFTMPSSGGSTTTVATMGVSSGKWYWEMDVTSTTTYYPGIGIDSNPIPTAQSGSNSTGRMYLETGAKFDNANLYAYGDQYFAGDVIAAALDMDEGTITFYRNGISQGVAYSGITGTQFPVLVGHNGPTGSMNYGQKPFKFPPPDGFQPLNAANVRPETVIARPDEYVDIVTFRGTGTTSQSIRGLNFNAKPDLVWIKDRDNSYSHRLADSVRGSTRVLFPDQPNSEQVNEYGTIDKFTLNGFDLRQGSNNNGDGSNTNNADLVAWCWKAGGDAFTYNKDGAGGSSASDIGVSATTLTLTGASINTRSKFGIYTYTGSGSGGATLNHGLEGTPGLVIYKKRTGSSSWQVYHQSLGGTVYNTLDEDVGDYTSDSTRFGGTNPTASTISLGTHANGAGPVVLYAWCDVPGLQKFGSWTGINSADGNFVELGFRPALVIAKESSATGAGAQWFMLDSSRNTYNPLNNILDVNRENAERQAVIYDFLSNGFKVRTSFNGGATFIYMAWAEAPSFNLYGAQSNAR